MLRFIVQNPGDIEANIELAHLIGPDDHGRRGEVKLRAGVIECRHPGSEACALRLLHDTGKTGRLMVQTCLLPDREEPYRLTLELARHQIKLFLVKCEEWQMSDLARNHPSMRKWEESRELFTEALTAADDVRADAAATASLEKAIDATERLAVAHAEILLQRRYASRPASSVTLGIRIWPGRDGKEPLRDLIKQNFDVLMLPLRWKEIEVEEGKYQWGPLDRWIEWAKEQNKPIIAGPLLDFSKESVPEWMYVWQHDYDTCRDLAYDYMERVLQRYAGAIGIWNLASGLNANANFQFTSAQITDLVRTARLLLQQYRKGARAMVELCAPFGEYGADHTSPSPIVFVDRLMQEGIKLDAIGVQLLMGDGGQGRAARDLMHVSALLDEFLPLEMPVMVTALGVPSKPASTGAWHSPWSEDVQSRWISRMFAIALSKPYVESIFWSDLYDHAGALLPDGGLIDDSGHPKPALSRLVGMRRRLRRPLGQQSLPPRESDVGASA